MCVGVLVPAWTIQPCFTLQPVFAVSLYAFFSRQQGLSTLILLKAALWAAKELEVFSRVLRQNRSYKNVTCSYILCSYYTYPVVHTLHTYMTYMTVFYERLLESWATEAPGSLPRRSESQFNCPAIPWHLSDL